MFKKLALIAGLAAPVWHGAQAAEISPEVKRVALPDVAEVVVNHSCPGVTGDMVRPIMATHTVPEYPVSAVGRKAEGTTTLKVIIGQDGGVKMVMVAGSTATALLDDAAVNHIAKYWRWEKLPAACEKTEVSAKVSVNWSVSDQLMGDLWATAAGSGAVIVHVVEPGKYPKDALQRQYAGIATVAVFVSEIGMVERVAVAKTSGHSVLDNDAQEIARMRKWEPMKMDGKAVGAVALMMVWYNLPGKVNLSKEEIELFMNLLAGRGPPGFMTGTGVPP